MTNKIAKKAYNRAPIFYDENYNY